MPKVLTVAVLLNAASPSPMPTPSPAAFVEVAKDVHLLRGAFVPGRQPDGNTVVLRGPAGLVVVDTGRHEGHTRRILDFARDQGQPIVAVVNTHWHLDHVGGNALLRKEAPSARVYASAAIRKARTGFLAGYRRQLEEMIAKTEDAEEQRRFRAEIALIDAGPALEPDDPVTEDGPRTLAGRPLGIHLEPRAVTAGDVWLLDPRSRTAIVGDLVTLPAPFLDTACPTGWKEALDRVATADFDQVVPGHGPVLSRGQFDAYRRAYGNLLGCASGKAPKAACVDGWLQDVGDLVPAADERLARSLLDYYADGHLRDAAKTARSCDGS